MFSSDLESMMASISTVVTTFEQVLISEDKLFIGLFIAYYQW